MPLNVGAPIGSDAYSVANTANAYARAGAATASSYYKNIFRYPLTKLEDTTTDYLLIKIYDYVPASPVFGIGGAETGYRLQAPNFSQSLQNSYQSVKYYITLPIPQSISDTTSVTWGEDRINPLEAAGLGFANEFIENGMLAGGAKVLEAVKAAFPNITTTQLNAVNNYLASQAVNGLGGNVSPASLVTRATGQVLQSNLELLFQGANLRSFPFTFDMVPRSRKEAEEVKNIIRTFKKTMSPSNGGRGSGTNTTSGLFVSSPSVYQLEYKSGSTKHPFLNTFKPCALTSINVNYTGSNTYATYDDGTPVHIQMTLTFNEINPVYEEDYEVGNAQTGVGY